MRGRQAPGPEFVQRLPGETVAKRRLEVILQTVAGTLSVKEAAATLGITPQRLHELRQAALQAGVEQLTPRPGGRPRKAATPAQQRIEALQAEVERLQRELAASQLRTQIALLLPGRAERGEKKRATEALSRATACAPPDPVGAQGQRRPRRGRRRTRRTAQGGEHGTGDGPNRSAASRR